jgi:glycosyltransferase involved in cell wall biosynthesis
MKVAIGTPMYGGICHAGFMQSIFQLFGLLHFKGHSGVFLTVLNESLISRARNDIARNFLQSDADVLLFIDADITFNAEDIYEMLMLNEDVIGSAVPLRKMNWRSLHEGILVYEGKKHPNKFGKYFNFNTDTAEEIYDAVIEKKPFEVLRIGTAILSIKRRVFEQMQEIVPVYYSNNQGEESMKSWDFFPVYVEDEILISEDFSFCNRWREMGNKVMAVGHYDIGHTGSFEFIGNLRDEVLKNKLLVEKFGNA